MGCKLEKMFNGSENVPKITVYEHWYHRGKMIGKGGFAKVYLGFDILTGQKKVALKVLKKDKNSEKYMKNEVDIMMNLRRKSNKHLTKLLGCVEDDEKLILVMEYCEGGTLLNLMRKKGRMIEGEARKWMRHIASGLMSMRDQMKIIYHRDLKPNNFLFTKDQDTNESILKISDFGISKESQRQKNKDILSENYSMVGTPAYMAPELLLGKGDEKSDLWSLGCILFEMLVGNHPSKLSFALPSEVEAVLSEECKEILFLLLEREVEKRCSWETFFAHPFISVLEPSHEEKEEEIEINGKEENFQLFEKQTYKDGKIMINLDGFLPKKKRESFFKDLFDYIDLHNSKNKEKEIRYISLENNGLDDQDANWILERIDPALESSNKSLWYILLENGNQISSKFIKKIEDCLNSN